MKGSGNFNRKRTGTKAPMNMDASMGGDRGMMGNTNTGGPFQHAIHTLLVGEYEEKPRPNLQNVIQKLREGSKAWKHVLLAAKIHNDSLNSKRVESDIQEFYKNIRDPEEDETKAKSFEERVDGVCAIVSPFYIHLMEFDEKDDRYLDLVMQALLDSIGKHTHEQVWVLHFTEEEPERVMKNAWFTKLIDTSKSSGREDIKSMTQYDKVKDIYTHMRMLGFECQKLLDQGKATDQVLQKINTYAQENLPIYDELNSACGQNTRSIADWIDFMAPPDILLEKELTWPVDPQLIY